MRDWPLIASEPITAASHIHEKTKQSLFLVFFLSFSQQQFRRLSLKFLLEVSSRLYFPGKVSVSHLRLMVIFNLDFESVHTPIIQQCFN